MVRLVIAGLAGIVGGPLIVEAAAKSQLRVGDAGLDTLPIFGRKLDESATAYAHREYDRTAQLAVGAAVFLVLGWLA